MLITKCYYEQHVRGTGIVWFCSAMIMGYTCPLIIKIKPYKSTNPDLIKFVNMVMTVSLKARSWSV